MDYRISYVDGWAAATPAREGRATRTEYFMTEYEALKRARELVDSGVHHGVSLYDSSGETLAGVLLQLKPGASVADWWREAGYGDPDAVASARVSFILDEQRRAAGRCRVEHRDVSFRCRGTRRGRPSGRARSSATPRSKFGRNRR
jgi:hypothetical protein